MTKQNRQVFEFGQFRLIPQEHQLLSDGKPVPLTPKSFDLLRVLVENSGHLVEKGELMNLIWPDSFVEEANLSVKMSEVRRALGEAPNEQKYVETVPRRGYRFVGKVTEHLENGTAASEHVAIGHVEEEQNDLPVLREAAAVSPPRSANPYFPKRATLIGLSALVLLVLIAAWFDVAGLRSRVFAPKSRLPIGSIAVLPLENFSGDSTQDYFAHGMTDALISDLAKIGSLRVISLMQYRGTDRPLSDIRRELTVDAFLTGSVVRSGDRVRISVQLIRSATDENLWSESYERDLRDVLSLQNEVARDIVSQVRIKLTPQEQLQFGNAPPVNPAAYEHYLMGKFYLNIQDPENNQKAIDTLEAAVAADPSFAAAYAELAQAYVWKVFLFKPDDHESQEKAFVASEKALSMDQNLAVAHLARGRLLWTPANRYPHEKAIHEYRRALELNPNLDEARNQLALIYNHIGATDESLAELHRALETNPGNSIAAFRIGETLLFAGRYEEAVSALRGVPSATNPALIGHQLVWALWNLGRKDEATTTMNEFLARYPDDNRGLLTSIQAVMAAADGHFDEADAKIKTAMEKGKGFGHFHHTVFHIACAYARMNNPDRAIELLEYAANDGFPNYSLFATDPNLDSLRSDPRFMALLERLRQQLEHYRSVT
jgi:Predicted integral membrane protein